MRLADFSHLDDWLYYQYQLPIVGMALFNGPLIAVVIVHS